MAEGTEATQAEEQEVPQAAAELKDDKPSVELNEKQQKIADEIDTLTVMELASLVKYLEEKYGVTAQAAVAAVAVA